MSQVRRVTGIGGIFFKARDPESLTRWYRRHLGVPADENNVWQFAWRDDERPQARGTTVWAPFDAHTTYLGRPRRGS